MSAGDENDHPIFQTDPSEWMSYIGKEVCVTVENGNSYTGWVYTIDPVSQSVVLARFDGDSTDDKDGSPIKLTVVMGHAVQSIVVLDDNAMKHKEVLDALFKPKALLSVSPEELKGKQDKLRGWLLKNRIPVTVSGENSEVLCVSDVLTIEPPYSFENCQSTNQIVLGRIQGLIKNMPKHVEDW